jgi:hypothetical protein
MYREVECELDLAKRAPLFIAMNDFVIEERVVIPILQRPHVAAQQQGPCDVGAMGRTVLDAP